MGLSLILPIPAWRDACSVDERFIEALQSRIADFFANPLNRPVFVTQQVLRYLDACVQKLLLESGVVILFQYPIRLFDAQIQLRSKPAKRNGMLVAGEVNIDEAGPQVVIRLIGQFVFRFGIGMDRAYKTNEHLSKQALNIRISSRGGDLQLAANGFEKARYAAIVIKLDVVNARQNLKDVVTFTLG